MDFSALAEQLFALASRQDIAARNRNILYAYVKKLRTFGETHTSRDMNVNSVACNEVAERCENVDNEEPLDNKDEGRDDSLPKRSGNDDEEKLVEKEDLVVQPVDYDDDFSDVNGSKTSTKKDDTKKTKDKRVRKHKCEDFSEGKTTVDGPIVSPPGEVGDNEKSAKTKRNKSGKNEIPAEMLENGQKPKSAKGKKKGKKRKSELVAVSSADNKEEAAIQGNQAVIDDAEVPQEESDLLNGSYLSTLPLQRRKLRSFGRKVDSAETTTLEIIESRLAPGEEGNQPGSRQESKDVNGIPDSPPLAMFLRHSVAKNKINTEPKKTKGRKRSVSGFLWPKHASACCYCYTVIFVLLSATVILLLLCCCCNAVALILFLLQVQLSLQYS